MADKIKIPAHTRSMPARKPSVAIMVGGKEPDHEEEGYFTPPDGFDTEGKKPGERVEFVGEAEVMPDGRMCLKKVNGIELSGEQEATGEAEPKTPSFTDAMMGGPEEGA